MWTIHPSVYMRDVYSLQAKCKHRGPEPTQPQTTPGRTSDPLESLKCRACHAKCKHEGPEPTLPQTTPGRTEYATCTYISCNAPYLALKMLHQHYFFNFSLDGCDTQEKWKIKVMQNFGDKYGALWEMCKWRMLGTPNLVSRAFFWKATETRLSQTPDGLNFVSCFPFFQSFALFWISELIVY